MRKTMSVLAATALMAALTLVPASAWAQACLANAASGGQGYVAASASFTDGAWGPGATAGFNVPGPLSVQGEFQHVRYDNSDVTANAIGATAAVELMGLPVSLCPTASVAHRWHPSSEDLGDFSESGVIFAGGLSFGHSIRGAGLGVMPHAAAGVVHDRSTLSFGEVSGTVSETYASFSGGVLLSSGSLYGGPSVSLSTLEGSDPVFSVGLGLAIGPRVPLP